MKKGFLFSSLLLFLALPLAACEVSNDDSPSSDNQSPIEPEKEEDDNKSQDPSKTEDDTTKEPEKDSQADVRKTLLSNFTGMKKFKAVYDSDDDYYSTYGSEESTYRSKYHNYAIVEKDNDNYSYSDYSLQYDYYKLSEFAASKSKTVDELIDSIEDYIYYPDSKYIIDKDKDDLYLYYDERPLSKKSAVYDEDAKQMILFKYHDNHVVNAKYSLYDVGLGDFSAFDQLFDLIKDVISLGTINKEGNEISFTVTDEFIADHDVFYNYDCDLYLFNDNAKSIDSITIDFDTNKNISKFTINVNKDELFKSYHYSSVKKDESIISLDITFSNVGTTTVETPTTNLGCEHHFINPYYYEHGENHAVVCSVCGLIVSEGTHTFDPVHHVCTTCGLVEGLDYYDDSIITTTNIKTSDDNYVRVHPLGEKGDLYAFGYVESPIKEKYDFKPFIHGTYYFLTTYELLDGGKVYYSEDFHAAIAAFNEEGDYLADNSCVYVSTKEYRLYENLTVEKSLITKDYLSTLQASDSVTITESDFRDDFPVNWQEEEPIDKCTRHMTKTCNRCGQIVTSRSRSWDPDDTEYSIVSYDEMLNLFDPDSGYGLEFDNSCVFIKMHCTDCLVDVYFVIKDKLLEDHDTEPISEHILTMEKVGYCTFHSYSISTTFPHIYDSNNDCVLCGKHKS